MGSRSSRSRWEKNQSHKPTTSWPNLQVRTCKIQAKLDSKLGPSVAINIQNQINQTKPYQTKPNQTKPKDLRMSYFCDLLLYSKLQILSLCENVFFQCRTKTKPNQTIPNWTKPNQNISDCLILVSCWCIQNFRSLGYLKIGFLNVAPGGWVRAAAGAGGKKISRKNIPLRGPTCMLEPCKISSRAEIPSWARVWQQPNKIKSTKPNQNTRDCLIFMSYVVMLCESEIFQYSTKTKPNHTKLNQTKPKHLGLFYPCELLVYTKFQIPWVS